MAVGGEMGRFPGAIFKSFTIKPVTSKPLHFVAMQLAEETFFSFFVPGGCCYYVNGHV